MGAWRSVSAAGVRIVADGPGSRHQTGLRDRRRRFDNNKYSVAASAVGRPVEVHAYADRIVIRQDGRIVAEHPRSFGRGDTVYDPWHYAFVANGTTYSGFGKAHSTPTCPGSTSNGQPVVATELNSGGA